MTLILNSIFQTLYDQLILLTKYTMSFQYLIWKAFIAKFVWLYIRLHLCNPFILLTSLALNFCIIMIIFNYSHFLILNFFLIFFLFIEAIIAKVFQRIKSFLSFLYFLFTIILNTKIFIIKIKVESSFSFFNDIFKISFFSFV